MGELLHVPLQCELKIMGQILLSAINKTWVLEGSKLGKSAVLVAHAVVRPDSAKVPLHILNIRDETITIRKGTIIAEMEVLPADPVSMVGTVQQTSAGMEQQEAPWKMVEKLGRKQTWKRRNSCSHCYWKTRIYLLDHLMISDALVNSNML